MISEANGALSREAITVLSGENLVAGTVIGKVTASGKYVGYDNDAADGSQVAAGILFDAVDASAADALGVAIVRLAEVDTDKLQWDAAVTTQGEKDAAIVDLAANFVIAR